MTTTWQDKILGTEDVVFSERQTDFLNALILKFNERTKKSKKYAQDYRKVLSDSKAASGFRLSVKEMFYPIVGESSYGSKLKDIDGNEYIDVTMGYGSHLLGNNPDCIQNALANELEVGITLGVRSKHMGEVASIISKLTGCERVAFCTTGTEAIMSTIRIARGKSEKNLIAIFLGAYHGHSDLTYFKTPKVGTQNNISPSLGIPENMLNNLLILNYGAEESLLEIEKYATDLAAVIVEPIQAKNPTFIPNEFLRKLRGLTKQKNIALIFDEMITGFRVHPGGAQTLLNVEADICTYGKVVGGGLPLSVIAGKSVYLDYLDGGYWQYGDVSTPLSKRVFFGGTYCQHPLALRSAKAILEHLMQAGPQLQLELNEITNSFVKELNELFIEDNIPIKVINFSSMFRFQMPSKLDVFYYLLICKGIYICEWRNCFLSTAHSRQDLEDIIRIVKESIEELKNAKFIEDLN